MKIPPLNKNEMDAFMRMSLDEAADYDSMFEELEEGVIEARKTIYGKHLPEIVVNNGLTDVSMLGDMYGQ